MKESVAVAIDLGGTKAAGAVVGQSGHQYIRLNEFINNQGGEEVGELIVRLIRNLLVESANLDLNVLGVGIAVPGICYADSGLVWAPNIRSWENYPLKARVEEGLPGAIPVSIDSDRACYVLGEVWQGAAVNSRHAIFLAVGTGIGAGIIIDGKVLRGAHDIAGAVGWMALTSPHIHEYSKYGCFEYHASGVGLARMATRLVEEDGIRLAGFEDLPVKDITARHVFDAYDRGDKIAIKVIDAAVEFWGKASANLISLFNPDMIVFGGGVFGPGMQLLDRIHREAQKWAQPVSIKQTTFVKSELGNDAGLYGAAFLIHQSSQQ